MNAVIPIFVFVVPCPVPDVRPPFERLMAAWMDLFLCWPWRGS